MGSLWLWSGFLVFVVAMLALDLGVFQRNAHEVKAKEALGWSAVWIALALAFGAGIWYWQGAELGLEYLAGYLLEKSLSVDNLFVFLLVFSTFKVPPVYQQRVLLWGVLGALVMRAAMILLGIDLIQHFHWVLYGFGAMLLVAGVRMALHAEAPALDLEQHPVVRLFRRFVPMTSDFQGHHFFARVQGRVHATPLFLALVVIEASDLVFAVDSIPAVFAVTEDPFIVYTSNVFALLGLRSLYFALASTIDRLHLFKYGLAAVLAFVGLKMVLADVYKLPTWAALGVIVLILGVAAIASLLVPKPGYAMPQAPPTENRHDDPRVPSHPAPRAARPPRERP